MNFQLASYDAAQSVVSIGNSFYLKYKYFVTLYIHFTKWLLVNLIYPC